MAAAVHEIPVESLPDPVRLDEAKLGSLFVKLVGFAVACAALLAAGGVVVGWKQFFWSYLWGFVWCLAVSLGALFWTMIHHVSDAGWSTGIRRLYENVHRTLLPLAFLFAPIGLGIGEIYKWSAPSAGEAMKVGKDVWLSPVFFVLRVSFYFAIWITYSRVMRRWSIQQDSTGDKTLSRKMQWWAPSGVAFLGLTATFASFDLIMSLNYTWFSTIFGVYFWAGGIRGSMAMMVVIVLILHSCGHLRNTVTREHFHDLGKLSFGFTVFWTYIAFAQYFLIWYGNIPEETKFYLDRRYVEGVAGPSSWYWMSVGLPVCYFIVPFLVLLPRGNKRSPVILGATSVWIMFFHAYDLYWQIMPEMSKATVHSLPSRGVHFSWMDGVSIAGFASFLAAMVVYGLKSAAVVPIRDPRLAESIHHEVDEFGDPK